MSDLTTLSDKFSLKNLERLQTSLKVSHTTTQK